MKYKDYLFKRSTIPGLLLLVVVGVALVNLASRPKIGSSMDAAESGTLQYQCPMHPDIITEEPGDCPICGMALMPVEPEPMAEMPQVEPVTQYQCPMHPDIITEEQGDCPICGMALMPVEPEASMTHAGHGGMPEGYVGISLNESRQQLIGVKTSIVERRTLTRTISTVGWIAYDPDLYHAQEEYIAALEGMRKMGESAIPEIRQRSEKLVESARLRLRVLGLNDTQIDALSSESEPDRRLLLGDGQDSVWLYGSVYEYELPLVQKGDTVDVKVRAFPGERFQGELLSIDSVLDPKTRSARVRVLIHNDEGKLKPQMFANARIHVSLGEHLAVPESAVLDTGMRKVVFVAEGEGRFVPREVELSHKAEDSFIVLSGLHEGERVVTSGNFLIDSESKLRAATSAAAAGSHQHE